MWTQIAELKPGGLVVALPEVGPTVKLLEQTGDGKVIYQDWDGETYTVPQFDFFSTRREANAVEVAAWQDKHPAEPDMAVSAAMSHADRAEAAAKRAEAAATRAEAATAPRK